MELQPTLMLKTTTTERIQTLHRGFTQNRRGAWRSCYNGLDGAGTRKRNYYNLCSNNLYLAISNRKRTAYFRCKRISFQYYRYLRSRRFTVEVNRSLAKGWASISLSAVDGVEPQSETNWRLKDNYSAQNGIC